VPQFIVAIYYSLKYHCYISTQARVQLTSKIAFGKGTVVKPFAILQTQGGRILTGENCAISSFNHISTGIEDVMIGNYVRIGPHATIMGGSRNFERKDQLIIQQGSYHKTIIIEDDVLIGASVTVLPGSRIGKGAVIGAMSLINQDIPPYSIVAGIPAKIIGKRE
jgi:acetyltransferase-like isoleucine patch superfamily enzyme